MPSEPRAAHAATAVLLALLLAAAAGAPPLLLEALGLMLFAMAAARCLRRGRGLVLLLLALLPTLALLQLIPLPYAVWSAMDGRAYYADALAVASPPLAAPRALSLVPRLTADAALFWLPALGTFALAVGLPTSQLRALAALALLIAAVQGAFGVTQFLTAVDAGSAQVRGTFALPSQFAAQLLLLLPVALALLAATLGRRPAPERYHSSLHGPLAAAIATRLPRSTLYALLLLVLLAGLAATRSPLALNLTLLALLLAAIAFAGRLGVHGVFGWRGTLAAVGACALTALVLLPVRIGLAGYARPEPDWTAFADSLDAAADFMPWGSGFGTLPAIAPRFHGDGFGLIDADWIAWLLGGGAAAAALLLLALLIFLFQWLRISTDDTWSTFRLLQIGCGIGLLLLLLYGLFANGLRAYGNAVSAALLAAVFVHRGRGRAPRQLKLRLSGATAPAPVARITTAPGGSGRPDRSDRSGRADAPETADDEPQRRRRRRRKRRRRWL